MNHFDELIKSTRKNLIILLQGNIEAVVGDKDLFGRMIQATITLTDLTQTDLSRITLYEKSQIGRWRVGKASPPKGARGRIIEKIIESLDSSPS